jgi:hypothetical protein
MLFGFIAALLFSFVFTAVLAIVFQRRGPGPVNGLFYFFLLILFISWATGTWIYPSGPMFGTVPWVGFLISAFFVMLFIAVLIPPGIARGKDEDQVEEATAITFGLLFWVFIIALGVIAISRSLFYNPVF